MQLALYAIYALGTFLAGLGAVTNRRRVKKLEARPPFRQLAKVTAERDEARQENARLRAQCRRLLKECSELKSALGEALREVVRLTAS